ncbi:MAG: ABC transporter ATP-binding protein [Lautropia sp.]
MSRQIAGAAAAAGSAGSGEPLLSVEGVRLGFDTPQGSLVVVDEVSFTVAAAETLAIVGESGCGKSVTAMSILRLTPARFLAGRVQFDGRNLATLDLGALRRVRGGEIGYIFQEPMTSLNPVFTVGDQIVEPLIQHRGLTRRQALREAVELLAMVNIPSPSARVHEYPHQLSGGMRQRVMIAIAISCRPRLLIADEPTTALDVTVQAQILELLRRLQRELGMGIILITHDMGVVSEFSDRVVVMYAGRIAEVSRTSDLFEAPGHPYTQALLDSIPPIDREVERLHALAGVVPSPDRMPAGCRFFDRCAHAAPPCREAPARPQQRAGGRSTACVRALDGSLQRETA